MYYIHKVVFILFNKLFASLRTGNKHIGQKYVAAQTIGKNYVFSKFKNINQQINQT